MSSFQTEFSRVISKDAFLPSTGSMHQCASTPSSFFCQAHQMECDKIYLILLNINLKLFYKNSTVINA